MKKILTTCLMTLTLSTSAHATEPSVVLAGWLIKNPTEIIQGVARVGCRDGVPDGEALAEQMLLTYVDFHVKEGLAEYSDSTQMEVLHMFTGAYLWEYFQLCNSEGA